MEITMREIFTSIVIIAIWLCVGLVIAEKIDTWQQDKNIEYYKAAKIEDEALFEHAMNTNLGNSFVYGELRAIDPVAYPEIKGAYCYITKIIEEYTMHTRIVTKTRTDANGELETYTETETYWEWDEINREEKYVDTVVFLGQQFDINKFDLPSADYIETIKKTSTIRYKYYGLPDVMTGTIYTVLKDGTISDNSQFYNSKNIEATLESLENGGYTIIFWIAWVVIMASIVYGFCYLDNRWLNE